MIRTFGLVTLTGSAQPLFGDKLTAAFSNVKADNGLYFATVANSAIYQVGDRWLFGAGQSKPNLLMVNQIISSTVVGFASEGNAPVSAWANTTQLALDIACGQIIAQAIVGNSGTAWFGADGTVTNVGGGSAFGQAISGGSWSYGLGQWNIVRTSEIWVAGTANDKLGVSAVVI